MATIPKSDIATGNAITALQILNIIEALDGTDSTDIVLDGIVTLNGATQASTGTNVLTVDGSGRIYKTGSYSAGGGSVSITADNASTEFVDIQVSPSPITGTGTVMADLNATGTPSTTTFLRGDNAWAVPNTSAFPYSGIATITGSLLLKDENDVGYRGNNMYIGPETASGFGSFAHRNVSLGDQCGGCAGSDDNVAIGTRAMMNNTANLNCVAIGIDTMRLGTGNLQMNTAVGAFALRSVRPNAGLYFGFEAYYNTAIGAGALQNTQNSGYNVAIGSAALQGKAGTFSPATQIVENVVAIGKQAGQFVSSGSGCVFIGAFAGRYMGGQLQSSAALTYHVKDNVFIGDECGDAKQNGNGNTYVGSQIVGGGTSAGGIYNETIIGNATTGTGTRTVNLGNTDVLYIRGEVSPTTYSDRRIKRNIESSSLGLNFINTLNTVRFQKVNPANYPNELVEAKYTTRTKFKEIPDYPYSSSYTVPPTPAQPDNNKWYDGLIAQEVSASLSTLNIESDIWSETETNQKQEIKYSALTIPLIKAVQELTARVEALEAQINGEM